HSMELRHRVAAEGVTDPDRAADAERIRPCGQNLRVFARADRGSVDASSKAGKIGSNRRASTFEKRARKVVEVHARHAETVHQNDVASPPRFAMRHAIGPAGQS